MLKKNKMNILSASEINNLEKKIITGLKIPEILLMESAAWGITQTIKERSDKNTSIAFLCGFGNNAGDGFASARLLMADGFKVTVFCLNFDNKFSQSAKLNFDILKNLKADLKPIKKHNNLKNYDIIVDSIFGIGLNRPIEKNTEFAALIKEANETNALKIAIDIPSGLLADEICPQSEIIFKADITISFSALKICQSLYPAKKYNGEIILKNIGIPESHIKTNITFLMQVNLPDLKKRDKYTHKGDYGKTIVIGGSAEFGGAPAIAAIAALKIGSGLTYLCIDDETDAGFVHNNPEIIIKRINLEETASISDFINVPKTSALIGCGMGRSKKAAEFIKNIVTTAENTLIIDADGINALTLDDLKNIKAPYALTPHLKEFAYLLNLSVPEVEKQRLTLAKEFAVKYNCVLVLKSADTIICDTNGDTFIADFGTPALAKGGSGDCLAGIITSLNAQGYPLVDAAKLAVFILGRSAVYTQNLTHEATVTISQVINNFHEALSGL